ncbi:MAG TPA: DUF397 domain-containing protein [Candidatus Limnocylindrales bacterium]
MAGFDGGGVTWRRAARCESNGCVEFRQTPDGVIVRNSTRPDGARLEFTRAEWEAFLAAARAGEFDPD